MKDRTSKSSIGSVIVSKLLGSECLGILSEGMVLGLQTPKVFPEPLLIAGLTALASHSRDYHPPAVTYFCLMFAP